MIIVLKPDATEDQIKHIVQKIEKLGLKPWVSRGKERSIVGVIGAEDTIRLEPLEVYPGVEKVMSILKPYKLVSRDFKKENTVIELDGGVTIGGEEVVVMAGPCSVEKEELLVDIAKK